MTHETVRCRAALAGLLSVPSPRLQDGRTRGAMIFLSYARADAEAARRLYNDLVTLGYDVWFDLESLLPGQVWALEIRNAIRRADYFIALISNHSVSKRGFVQAELRQGIETYANLPEGAAFLIPVKLDPVDVPFEALNAVQWVEMFPEYDNGLIRLLRLLEPSLAPAIAKTSSPLSIRYKINRIDGTRLQYVPQGEYVVGSSKLPDQLRKECRDWSSPARIVLMSSYWIAQTPIRNDQYRQFLTENPDHPPPMYWDIEEFNQDSQPVVGVSWYDAQSYCKWAGLALPSEAQWEVSARGPDARPFPWGSDPPTPRHANFGTRIGKTTPVDYYAEASGPFGTYDQAGNVWEWCQDAWDPKAYERLTHKDPLVTTSASSGRVIRGGSAVYSSEYLLAAIRERFRADHNSRFVGFRCASSDAWLDPDENWLDPDEKRRVNIE